MLDHNLLKRDPEALNSQIFSRIENEISHNTIKHTRDSFFGDNS